ncbi:unnamed protein product, partial [Staurois parvus]
PWPSVWTVLIGPVLITCTLPRKQKHLSSNTHQTEHVHSVSTRYVLSVLHEGSEMRKQNTVSTKMYSPIQRHSHYWGNDQGHYRPDTVNAGSWV